MRRQTVFLGSILIVACILLFYLTIKGYENKLDQQLTTSVQRAMMTKQATADSRRDTAGPQTGIVRERPQIMVLNDKDDDNTDDDGDVDDGDDDEYNSPDDSASMVFLRKYGRLRNLPTYDEMEHMSEKEMKHIFHSYLDNTDYHCRRKIRLGNSRNGGYETCDDYAYRPLSPCLVYSFGIKNKWMFDDDAARLYKCNVFSFDPSMTQADHQRSERVYFYRMGIGGDSHETSKTMMTDSQQSGWIIKTLTEFKAMLHHENRTLDILKIDVESSEWPALKNMIRTGELNRVRQLHLEIHKGDLTLREKLSMFQQIEVLGFRRFATHFVSPPGSTKESLEYFPVERKLCCYEVNFVNTRLARKPLP